MSEPASVEPWAIPERRDPTLDRLAQDLVVAPRVAPAASLAVAWRVESTWRLATGAAGVRSTLRPEPIAPDSPFDLASVSKPLVALTASRLAARGALDLDSPLERYVPELAGLFAGSCPLDLLLAHRAGLAAHVKLHEPVLAGRPFVLADALVRAAASKRSECRAPHPEEGYPPVYSDLGYLLLGQALANQTGLALDELLQREVLQPLGLSRRLGSARQLERTTEFHDRVVPTETERWRGGEIVGEVHDENSWVTAGLGVAGPAGVFGDAAAIAQVGAAVIECMTGKARFLGPEALERLLRPRPGGSLRAGFDGKSSVGSSAGERFAETSFGHLGFTGTSLWCDPEAARVAVALTNRVSPTRDEPLPIRAARPRLHDALHEYAGVSQLDQCPDRSSAIK